MANFAASSYPEMNFESIPIAPTADLERLWFTLPLSTGDLSWQDDNSFYQEQMQQMQEQQGPQNGAANQMGTVEEDQEPQEQEQQVQGPQNGAANQVDIATSEGLEQLEEELSKRRKEAFDIVFPPVEKESLQGDIGTKNREMALKLARSYAPIVKMEAQQKLEDMKRHEAEIDAMVIRVKRMRSF